MTKKVGVGGLILLLVITVGFVYFNYKQPAYTQTGQLPTETRPLERQVEPFTASFEVYTNGIKRDFSASMYHRLSPDAYIQPDPPNEILVTKPGTTWQDFFDTLPFSLSEECLKTGTGQTFCNSENASLHFYLNGEETEDVLTQQITPGANLVVRYK